MLSTTAEWVSKAEGDFDVVSLLLRSRKRNRYDAICFHAQQCVEKYLKGRMVEAGIPFSKTYDLRALLNFVSGVEPLWVMFSAEFKLLSESAVLPRYPGMNADNADERTAVKTCRRFRQVARLSLGLKP